MRLCKKSKKTTEPSQDCMLAWGPMHIKQVFSQTCPGWGRLECPSLSESDLRLGAGAFPWFISHHLGSEELRLATPALGASSRCLCVYALKKNNDV